MRGSIVYSSDHNNSAAVVNAYDEYGQPGSNNAGRFQYTRAATMSGGHREPRSQVWLPELGMYYYKARIYSPRLGRFMQTDPIGYDGGIGLYVYAKNDPINLLDYSGNAPGDRFDDPKAAAEDAINHINPTSIAENVEYSGTVEREVTVTTSEETVASGMTGFPIVTSVKVQYYATKPERGTGDKAKFRADARTTVADYGTHGDYSRVGANGAPERIETNLSQSLRKSFDMYNSDDFSRGPESETDTTASRTLAQGTKAARMT